MDCSDDWIELENNAYKYYEMYTFRSEFQRLELEHKFIALAK